MKKPVEELETNLSIVISRIWKLELEALKKLKKKN